MRYTAANSPKVGGYRGIPCRKGQAPSLRGGACDFALSCGKRGCCCAARRGRRALQGECGFARRIASVECCCAERRGRRSLPGVCGFAEGRSKPLPLLRGRRDAAPYKAAAGSSLSFPLWGKVASAVRRMTEEGERYRQQTVKPFAHSHGCGHFHIAVPPRSPSPVALVGGTLPRRGRDRERANRKNTLYKSPPPRYNTTSNQIRREARVCRAAFPRP